MQEPPKIRVGITLGDLNGIGGEIILKSFEDPRMTELCTPVIFASGKTMSAYKRALNINTTFHGIRQAGLLIHGKVNVVNLWHEDPAIRFGEANSDGGKYALLSLEAAVGALQKNEIDVLVTAPINKKTIQSDRFKFPGHTDYLAEKFKGESLMFMVAGDLRIGLLTDHVPVKDIAGVITQDLVRKKIDKIITSLKMDFKIRKPRIALLGINPHSGDSGVIGSEDDEILKPVIRECLDAGKVVMGPFAADSFFGGDQYRNYDAILAAYHDQGLIPFKTLSFGRGVNFTAGLSIVRTSPDHGTAFEIAGKNQADSGSFKEALFTAMQIFRNREEYLTLIANPLKPHKMKRKVSG